MRRSQSIRLFLSVGLIIFSVAYLLRATAKDGMSPIGGVFFANSFRGMIYTAQHGHVYWTGGLDIASPIGRHVYSSSSDQLRTVTGALFGIIFINSPTPEELARLLQVIPFPSLFIFPASVLVFSRQIRKYRLHLLTILIAFSLLGTYQIIYLGMSGFNNAPVGWAFILFSLWTLRKYMSSADGRYLVVFLFMSGGIVGYYHTAAIVMVLVLGIMSVFFAGGSNERDFLLSFSLSYLLIFYVYFSRISKTYFQYYAIAAVHSIGSLIGSSSSSAADPYFYLDHYSLPLSIRVASYIPRMIVIATFAGTAVTLILTFHRRDWSLSILTPTERVATMYLIALVPVTLVVVFTESIITGLTRGFQYGAPIVPIAAVSLVNRTSNSPRIRSRTLVAVLLVAFVILAPVASSYAFLETPSRQSGGITSQEYSGVQWTTTHVSQDVIFTDYRLASPFMSNGYYSIASISLGNPQTSRSGIGQIFYAGDGQKAVSEIREHKIKGEEPKYAVFSSRMKNNHVKVNLGGFPVKPATDEGLEKYRRTNGVQTVYTNGELTVYHLG